jgi:hypothetical protein
MAGIRRLHRVHGKNANGIGHKRVLDCVRHNRSFVRALAPPVARKAPAVAPPGLRPEQYQLAPSSQFRGTARAGAIRGPVNRAPLQALGNFRRPSA